LAAQEWHSGHGQKLEQGKIPNVWTMRDVEEAGIPEGLSKDDEEQIYKVRRRWASGEVYLDSSRVNEYVRTALNVNFSVCFNCTKTAVWIHDRIAWPDSDHGFTPAEDMPTDVRSDFQEAASIIEQSPRGAAALLRLAVQKLCRELGAKGENINDDIAFLVKNGLDPRIQQALDVVRVIGNNAVHPGSIDFLDDVGVAHQLFSLVNLIVEVMITQPAHIKRVYDSLPQGALAAIERRDEK
jgi:hypothetical protein